MPSRMTAITPLLAITEEIETWAGGGQKIFLEPQVLKGQGWGELNPSNLSELLPPPLGSLSHKTQGELMTFQSAALNTTLATSYPCFQLGSSLWSTSPFSSSVPSWSGAQLAAARGLHFPCSRQSGQHKLLTGKHRAPQDKGSM